MRRVFRTDQDLDSNVWNLNAKQFLKRVGHGDGGVCGRRRPRTKWLKLVRKDAYRLALCAPPIQFLVGRVFNSPQRRRPRASIEGLVQAGVQEPLEDGKIRHDEILSSW